MRIEEILRAEHGRFLGDIDDKVFWPGMSISGSSVRLCSERRKPCVQRALPPERWWSPEQRRRVD
jgi:hypothetical protein